MNNTKAIGNSIHDNRLDNSVIHRTDEDALRLVYEGIIKVEEQRVTEDCCCSTKSYGSHKNRPFKDDSHKGSIETMDDDEEEGEEKKDASKEDLDQDGGSTTT